jgi:RNase H-fold protein (predicted Holliday junction resolvase)
MSQVVVGPGWLNESNKIPGTKISFGSKNKIKSNLSQTLIVLQMPTKMTIGEHSLVHETKKFIENTRQNYNMFVYLVVN